jgi:hypothetical protein
MECDYTWINNESRIGWDQDSVSERIWSELNQYDGYEILEISSEIECPEIRECPST